MKGILNRMLELSIQFSRKLPRKIGFVHVTTYKSVIIILNKFFVAARWLWCRLRGMILSPILVSSAVMHHSFKLFNSFTHLNTDLYKGGPKTGDQNSNLHVGTFFLYNLNSVSTILAYNSNNYMLFNLRALP